ncbi:glycosyltransferase family 39 protein [Phascolarctobacterium faecium]|nr:glycosyltransferase family 39 protein [Phascolarctobacterium faecium]
MADGIGVQNIRLYRIRCPFLSVLFWFGRSGAAYLGAKKLFDDKTAFYSGLVLLTSVEFFLISKSVITDAILFFFFSAVLLFFYFGYSTRRKSIIT